MPFHVFLGAHSLLIGLLPFYLPVFLWRHGIGLDGLSVLIGMSGFTFALALRLWHKIGSECKPITLVGYGFILEILLIITSISACMLMPDAKWGIWLVATGVGITAGAYNAFFWTTQRVLFAASLHGNDAGKRYGNFQIYVAVLLKGGIIAGGLLLDMNALPALVILSGVIGAATTFWLASKLPREPLLSKSPNPPLSSTDTATPTRAVFLVDGVFLLLESHFWTLSLFLLFGEDIMRLGTLVVALGIVFAILFWLSKNFVDRFAVRQVFCAAVVLYGLSWVLRSIIDDVGEGAALGAMLVMITFTTSFFRLAFNKRFFEHALASGVVPYLLWKSRLSQYGIGVVFIGIAMGLIAGAGDPLLDLSTTYVMAAVFALVYLIYQTPRNAASGP